MQLNLTQQEVQYIVQGLALVRDDAENMVATCPNPEDYLQELADYDRIIARTQVLIAKLTPLAEISRL